MKLALLATAATLGVITGADVLVAGDGAPALAAQQAVPKASSSASTDAAEGKSDVVTITAAPRARWQTPVCPSLTGLAPNTGDFILARLSEVARNAGVPLAEKKCRPNLYLFVSAQTEPLLRAMERNNRTYVFGDLTQAEIDYFINDPWPIRVMYSEKERHPINVLGTIYRVFVIIDTTRLRGANVGQIADYVAMVSLAQVNMNNFGPGSQLRDVDTILTLFSKGPQAAAAEMSDWDLDLLKSLYAVKVQRNDIAPKAEGAGQ